MQAFSCSFSWSNKTSHITTGASEGRDGLKSWILAIIYPFGNLGIFLNSGRIYTYDIRSWFLNQTHLKCGYTLNQVKGCRVLGPRWSDYLLCNNAKSLLLTTIILFCSQFRGTRIRELFGLGNSCLGTLLLMSSKRLNYMLVNCWLSAGSSA